MAGAPAKYDPHTAMMLIRAKMTLGKSLSQICREEGMPSLTTVMRWLDEDEGGALREHYMRAREALGDSFAERTLDVIFDEDDDPNNKRVKLDGLKWLAGKMNPKRYGDKVENTVVGPGGGPVLIATGVVRAED
jgi:hypothetical protein